MTVEIEWDEVTVMASELSDLETLAQDEILLDVHTEVNNAPWPDDVIRKRAALALARHLGVLKAQGGGMNQASLSAVSVGSVSKQFSRSVTDKDTLKRTGFGEEYMELVNLYLRAEVVPGLVC